MLNTQRLHLIAASAGTITSALEDLTALSAQLEASIPASWPPDLLDREALEFTRRWFSDPANDPQWGFYWVVLRSPRTLVGVVGYKGMPRDGSVEIGYGIVAEHQRRGYATEAAQALINRAFATDAVQRVIAETLPGLMPSIGVLENCGFTLIGEGSEPGVIRYELVRFP